jgi:HSP20 family molecular chaperone IbpA
MYTTRARFPKLFDFESTFYKSDILFKPLTDTPTTTFDFRQVDDATYSLEVNVVGHDPNNVAVEVTDTSIIILANKTEGISKLATSLDLLFELPKDVDGSKTEATITNGVLSLVLRKRTEKESKKIKIKF